VRNAWLVLTAGFLAGVVGDVLFHDVSLGVNVLLWLAALVAAGWALRRADADLSPISPWLLGLVSFFGGSLAWRASPFLRFWDSAAIMAAAVVIGAPFRGRVARAWPSDYLKAGADLAIRLAGGVASAAARLPWPSWRTEASASRARASGIGLALAVPVVVVFGGLLTSADPVLEAFVQDLFTWDLGVVFEHLLLILVLGWLATGWLWSITTPRAPADGSPIKPPRTLGLIEIALPLGAFTLLMAGFIGLQARYLFGGETFVRSTGLTYAMFARRGFFELVFLSLLAVPLLYGAQWVLERGNKAAVQSFRALILVSAALVILVMVSALARMRLYVASYGLTEDRLYATAFMIWIGCVLLWFVVTELRSQASRFATGAVAAGFAVLAALNVLNPDALVARTNIARAELGLAFDAEYLGRLSTDAVPAVVEAWPGLDVATRCALRSSLIERARVQRGWREWTWASWTAARATGQLPPDDRCPDADDPTERRGGGEDSSDSPSPDESPVPPRSQAARWP